MGYQRTFAAPGNATSALAAAANVSRPAVLLGASIPSGTTLADFQALNTAYAPRKLDLLMFFQDIDGSSPIWFSAYPTTYAAALGATMYITWSPSSGTLTDAIDGQDTYLAAEAVRAKNYGKPVIVRLAHEFNGDWTSYGYDAETPAEFIAAWRHIVDVFRANGAGNVQWMFGANVWTDAAAVDPRPYYPGDDYVDYISLDGYMTPSTTDLMWPEDLFLASYTTMCAMSPRPFMIGEVGVGTDDRVTAEGGKAEWFKRLFAMVRDDMPRCVAVNYWERIDGDVDYTTNSSGADATGRAAFVREIKQAPMVGGPASTAIPAARNKWVARQDFQSGITYAGSPSTRPGLMPTGAIAENYSRFDADGVDAGTPATGIPLILPGPWIPGGETVTNMNLFVSSGAGVGQTHAWVAWLDVAGNVLGVSADAGTSPWASTFSVATIACSLTAPAGGIQTLAAVCFTGTTWPKLRGKSVLGSFPAAFSPILFGPLATTQSTPPSVGDALGLPAAGSLNNVPYLFAS